MKSLMFGLIAGLLTVIPAFAGNQNDFFLRSDEIVDDFLSYASNFMGKDVFIANAGDIPKDAARPSTDWEIMGQIDDLVLKRDGRILAVLIDAGGLLGIGAKTIAVEMKDLRIVDIADSRDFYLVVACTREEIEDAPEYVHSESMGTPFNRALYPVRPYGRPDISPLAEYKLVETSAVCVSDLKAARVYTANHEDIASVSEVLVTPDGKVERVIIDVGGFLGIGSHSVSFELDELEVHQGPLDLRVYLPLTEKELRNKPEYVQ